MAEALQKLENIFSEETFTRRPLINYTVKYFADLASIVSAIDDENDINTAIETAKAQLDRNSQQIAALYSMGLLNFKKENYSDQSIERVLFIFKNAKKWSIVEYIAKKILDEYYESDYALRYLASYYQATNKEGEALDVWERLIKFDTSNPDLPEKVAHLKENAGNINEAIHYYKIAFERNIIRKRTNAESDIKKILELNADSYAYLSKHENALSELLDADVMIDIWKIMFFYYFENKRYDDSLKTMKHLLNYEQSIVKQNNKKAKFFRHRLVDVYKELYPNHTLFDKIEELSAITNVFKQPKVCIDMFEKYIQYDVGKYVFHRSFGVGRIKSISIDELIIKFVSQDEDRKMTFDMAIKSLIMLPPDDINVYKAYKQTELKKLVDDDPTAFLTIILKYKGSISTKDLKQEMVPSVIAENVFSKWLEHAKKAVRASTSVKFDKNTFLYNEGALTYDSESLNKFNNASDFFEKYQIYVEYLNYTPNLNSDEAKEMYDYFVRVAKDEKSDNESRIISIIYLKTQGENDKDIPHLDELIKNVENYTHIYEVLPSANYRERYITSIARGKKDKYYDIILKMLYSPHVKNHYLIVNKLFEENKIDLLEHTIDDIFLHYKEYPESFLYFAQKILDGEYVEELDTNLNINKDLLMIGLLSLIPYLTKLSDKKETSAHARKMLKIVYDLTFEKCYLLKFIEIEDEEHVKTVFSEFQKLINLEQHYKTDIISAVTKRFPNLNI